MCGICGAVGYRAETGKKKEVLTGMMEAIRHRGPDGGRQYVTEEAMLGFMRLSIIDKEGGMQPMRNEDGKKVLVYNGEIYNYQMLRKKLMKLGHIFSSLSDSEVLVHGYEEYGTELLNELRGMFSFAIWDAGEQSLFAARDFFGIKPFYYAQINGTFVFASEIKSILKFPGYKPVLNEEALAQYLSFQYSVLPETFFRGIYRLMPGHYLEYKNRELRITRYFEPTLQPENTENDVQELVCDSVRKHLVSDVEVGSFLSGGVDSSLIAAISGCKKTFTVGFADEGDLYDETGDVKELAGQIGVENDCRYIRKDEFFRAVPNVMYHLDEPSGDASAIALYFLAQEASGKVKVVLSGEGADEIFGGYNIYLEPKMLRYMNWIPFGIRRGLAKAAETILPVHMKGRNYLIRAGRKLSERYIGNAYIFHEEEKEKLLLQNGISMGSTELLRDDYEKLGNLQDSEQMQAIDLKYWLPGDILQKADKMSMAHSLELRVPYLDREVFREARRISHKEKTKHYTTKYVLRELAAQYLPRRVSRKKKLGFPVPIRNWLMEEECYQKMRELFSGQIASCFFHTDYLLELLCQHRLGKADNSRKIWTVYAFLVWYQVFFEGGWNTDESREGGSPSTCD